MPPTLSPGTPPLGAPTFYVIDRQPIRPAAVLLAILTVAVALSLVASGLGHGRGLHLAADDFNPTRSSSTPDGAHDANKDEKDDPSQVDTIVVGDAADAPVPAHRGDHISNVHATIIVHLPRYGEQTGLIPNTATGHLLYGWLAAFNQASYPALEQALPNTALAPSAAAQMQLRQQTGGFNLLSAKEIQPGVLVFRLRDQTPEGTEVLGTLQMRPNSSPAAIASFSLRAVDAVGRSAAMNPTLVRASSAR
jgi:hypothetical protein